MPLLEVRGATKRFPGVLALDGVHLTLKRGEVLAVIGENGAGKSTLMKILAGVERPDAGQILLDGQPAVWDSVQAAGHAGIALIHQELNLSENLDVAANICLGREPRRFGLLDQRRIVREAREALELIGLSVSPRTLVGDLSVGQRQMVEIAKSLATHARILIMDEPTSSLSQGETESLFRVVRDLREQGVSVIYISHRLSEVDALADRVLVLRDGRVAGELPRSEIDHDRMVGLMVGRDIASFYSRKSHQSGDVRLEVEHLVTVEHPNQPLSFSVRAGEIVGIAGLVGAGRTELLCALFGIRPPRLGQIRFDGQEQQFRTPVESIRAGIAFVPEDRKQQGLILEMAVRSNLSLAEFGAYPGRFGWLNRRIENRRASEMIQKLAIKTPNADQVVQYLSGGNQQKVVLGKWLALRPRLLLMDEPTRGIDVGAKEEIYNLMEELAEQGVAVLFVSSEMEEILGIPDRVLVMHEGRLAGELSRPQLTEQSVMRLATGARNLDAAKTQGTTPQADNDESGQR
jgi:ribose transport system ATP-binding protein